MSRNSTAVALAALGLAAAAAPGDSIAGEVEVAWSEHRQIAALFRRAGVEGTFVSCRHADGVATGHNAERAMERLAPASTFKIPHTLIALETGAVEGPEEVFGWDGNPGLIPGWEQDMTLTEAMRSSNLHVYREIAGRVGGERMRRWLTEFGYGNRDIGDDLENFWLEGPLAISAVEQCRFLLRLAGGELPISAETLAALRGMLGEDQGHGVQLYAKTGWAGFPGLGTGWWVGWIEGPFGRAGFALNLEMAGPEDAPLRLELGREALHVLGLLP